MVGCIKDLVTEEVVDIVLFDAICVRGVGANGVYGQVAVDVVDHVRWLVDIADARRDRGREVGLSSGLCGSR